jgi:regulation of enolase protein 1 (concanavalin A-like superfamily)
MRSSMAIGQTVVVAVVCLAALAASTKEGYGQTLPSPWSSRNIGAASGGATESTAGTFTISASGADIWGTSDQFRFVYQQVSGDVDVIARVDSLLQTDVWAKAGVMIRASLAADSAHGLTLVSAARGIAFQWRPMTGGASASTAGPTAAAPRWVRVVRAGTTVSSYTSRDGSDWKELGRETISLGATAYVGIAVTSHNASALTTAVVSHVAVVPLSVPSTQKWLDIGAPALASTVTHAGGTYDVRASGADIWGTSDQFNYLYQPISGDFEVSVRVDFLGKTNNWSKTGVMVRETLGARSRHASALLSAANGFVFQRRVDPGGYSVSTAGGPTAFPGWVKLVRRGGLFEAFRSADGAKWVAMGSDAIPMAETVYVGIATTSHDAVSRTEAVLDDFAVAPLESIPSGAPRAVVFHKSPDHDTLVVRYELRIFAGSANPDTTSALARSSLGKPVPDANGDITVDESTFFSSLAAGSYVATIAAIGSSGSSQSAAVAFSK